MAYRNQRNVMLKFDAVEPQHDRMLVLASGPSGAGPWPEHPGVPVIAVNGAIEGLNWAPDYWFTLDPSPDNMRRLSELPERTTAFMALDPDFGPEAQDIRFRQDFSRAIPLCRKRNLPGLSYDTRIINMGNSGRAAVQLAMHMGASRIAVFGVDGTDEPHWHNPDQRSGNLSHLGRGCAHLTKPGVDIVFASTGSSRVQGQTLMRPAAALDWLLTD